MFALTGQPSLAANPDNLPGLDQFDGFEAIGHQGQEVFQQDRLPTKNYNRDLSSLQILLVFKSTIDRQNYVEFGILGCGQKLAILKSGKASIAGCLTIVSGKVVAQALAHALVKKNPHSRLGG
jgi:hypothetical protein